MAAAMTNLKISQDKVQLARARKAMDLYDLCSSAGISYASYRRIMKEGNCKIAALGKISQALGVDVADIMDLMINVGYFQKFFFNGK